MAFGDNQIDGYEDKDTNVVFHYKQGSFRKRENQIYSDLATGKTKTRKGLFKALVDTKGNRIMFFTLLAVTAFALAYSLIVNTDNRNTINGTSCYLSAFSFEDTVYVSVECKNAKKSNEKDLQILNFNLEAIDSDGTVSNKSGGQVSFDRTEKQYFRTTFTDYNIAHITCEINDSKDKILLSCKVEKK